MGGLNDPERLLRLQRQLTVVALSSLTLFILLQIGAYFADLLRILALSFLLAYLVINIVDFLDKYMRNRALAVLLVYVLLLTMAGVAGFIVIPAMVYQVTSLVGSTIDKLPEFLQKTNEALIPLQQRFHERMLDIKVTDIITNLATQLPKPDPAAIASRVTEMAMGTMTWVIYSISISVTTFYFLLDGHRMKEAVIRLFPQSVRPRLDVMAKEMDRSLQSFFKGQLVLGCLFGIVMLFVYLVFDVQYALLLSVFLALCEILPVIGPPIGFAPAAIAVAIHGSALPGARIFQIILLTAIFAALQQIKDSVVAPKYMGNVIGMHPVMIFIAIMVGARLDGMLGIILALPAACVLSVIWQHLPMNEEVYNSRRAEAEPVVSPVSTSAENTIGASPEGPLPSNSES